MRTGELNGLEWSDFLEDMTPDPIRKEVWMPALEKAGLDYRPPLQTRHTFATMMISAGERCRLGSEYARTPILTDDRPEILCLDAERNPVGRTGLHALH